MLLKATKKPSKGFFLFVLSCGLMLHTTAQNQVISGPQEILLKGTILTAKDSTEIAHSNTLSTSGVGSVLAKYGKANQLYYKMIDSLAKVIFRHPLEASAGLNY